MTGPNDKKPRDEREEALAAEFAQVRTEVSAPNSSGGWTVIDRDTDADDEIAEGIWD